MELNEKNYYKIKKIFINFLLKKGKKRNSEKIFKEILIKLKIKTKQNPNFILLKSIKNLLLNFKIINMINKKKKNNNFFLIYLNKEKQLKEAINLLILNTKISDLDNEIININKKKSKIINLKKEIYLNIKKLKFNMNF